MTRTLIRPMAALSLALRRSRTAECARSGAQGRLALGTAERALKDHSK